MKDGGIHPNSEKLTRSCIGNIGAKSLAEALGALAISMMKVSGLIDTRFNSDAYKGTGIEEVLGYLCKFLSSRKRIGFCVAPFDYQRVG